MDSKERVAKKGKNKESAPLLPGLTSMRRRSTQLDLNTSTEGALPLNSRNSSQHFR